jgi:hypothetical protein
LKTLTDKEKLMIIETIKRELILTIEKRRKDPNWKPAGKKTRVQFKDEFDKMSRIWLIELFGHYGLKIDFTL